MLVGTDVGGTFTDVAVAVGDEIVFAKAPTTPRNMADGIADALERLGMDLDATETVFHGTTAIINAILERKGAKTALVTTEGFRDVYELGRGSRWDPYDMLFPKPEPLVKRMQRYEIRERTRADGQVQVPFDRHQAQAVAREIAASGTEAVAVCFLHAYAAPEHEARMLDVLAKEAPDVARTASHELVREYREYERTSTTVLNAYVMPGTVGYLGALEQRLRSVGCGGRVLLMQSNGGCMDVERGKRVPLALLESGPSSGAIAAAELARRMDLPRVVAFDMGGTTAKATLIEDFAIRTERPYYVGGERLGLPSLLPVVDLAEIGAGGGSVAFLDPAGALKVGPRSAGAVPGPACYGAGGSEATVTDADLLLGRIDAASFFGGEMRLNVDLAERAVGRTAEPLGLSPLQAAEGIVRIVDNAMALAVRQVSIERGRDPRDLTLIAFGGAGPVHALAVARQLGMPRVIVPPMAANFSAFGMLVSDIRHDFSQTYVAPLDAVDEDELERAFSLLEELARGALSEAGVLSETQIERVVEIRYLGQEHTLAVPAESLNGHARELLARRYHDKHEAVYGFRVPYEPMQTVNLRITATGHLPKPTLKARSGSLAGAGERVRPVIFEESDGPRHVPVHRREALSAGATVIGPALIEEATSTTTLHPGDRCEVDTIGNLVIEVG